MELEPPPTLEELVKELRISLHLLDQKCSDEHLKSISLFLDWRSVAPHLGLSERDIEAIEFVKKTEDERRLAVLQKWKRKYGYKATLKRLVAVLLSVGNADDAEQVCRLLPTSAGKDSASTATATTPTTPGDHQQSSPVTATEASLCSTAVETSKVQSPPSGTPPAPLPLPTPLESSELETNAFDMIAALLSAGVPHIVEQILQSLDGKSLAMSEQVSSTWRDVIADLRIWKHLIKHKIDSNPLWRALFKKRGWHKYLDMPPAEQMSKLFYRQLHHSACRDIHSMEANWRRGHYILTRSRTASPVNCLQYDDSKIVTGHDDTTIKIWDSSTLQFLKMWRGHKNSVECLQFNEEVVISGSYDRTVKVWDIKTSQVINDLLHHKHCVRSLKFTRDTLVTGSNDRTVAVWDIKSPTDITLKMTLKGHESYVIAVDFSETTIISGSYDKTIKVWDSSSGELLRTLSGHRDRVRCLQLLGSHLISGSDGDTIRIWSIDTGECIRVLHGHANSVLSVAVDNKRILSGSVDGTIKVWDLAAALDVGSSRDALCITTLKGHTNWVYGIQFDDFQVISGSADGTILTHNFYFLRS